jgi:hypothetical protein
VLIARLRVLIADNFEDGQPKKHRLTDASAATPSASLNRSGSVIWCSFYPRRYRITARRALIQIGQNNDFLRIFFRAPARAFFVGEERDFHIGILRAGQESWSETKGSQTQIVHKTVP